MSQFHAVSYAYHVIVASAMGTPIEDERVFDGYSLYNSLFGIIHQQFGAQDFSRKLSVCYHTSSFVTSFNIIYIIPSHLVSVSSCGNNAVICSTEPSNGFSFMLDSDAAMSSKQNSYFYSDSTGS